MVLAGGIVACGVLRSGMVRDRETGLMWSAEDNGYDIDWPSARQYCEELTLAGYSDWRLPTIDELATIYDSNNVSGTYRWSGRDWPIKTKRGFRLSQDFVWSETTAPSRVGVEAWSFSFGFGQKELHRIMEPELNRALCVRR